MKFDRKSIRAYLLRVAAKSVTGIDVPKPRDAQALSDMRFFCARFMVGCMGALRSAGYLWASTSNPCNSSPFRLTSFGGVLNDTPKEASNA